MKIRSSLYTVFLYGLLFCLFYSCTKKEYTPTLVIGDKFQGGIVAYILVPGDTVYDPKVQHGILAAIVDQNTGIQWYNGVYISTGAQGTAIGTGMASTKSIISSQGIGTYALSVCTSYRGGGYSDWYLPSKDELYILAANKIVSGGTANNIYWCSTEINNIRAWAQYINFIQQIDDGKAAPYFVKAVRSF